MCSSSLDINEHVHAIMAAQMLMCMKSSTKVQFPQFPLQISSTTNSPLPFKHHIPMPGMALRTMKISVNISLACLSEVIVSPPNMRPIISVVMHSKTAYTLSSISSQNTQQCSSSFLVQKRSTRPNLITKLDAIQVIYRC